MLYIHENNLKNKINTNYHGLKEQLEKFYNDKYMEMRSKVDELVFNIEQKKNFIIAAKIFNDYYDDLLRFSKSNGVNSQSKFESTFLEEISVYLVKDIKEIVENKLGIFNKKIYAGLKIDGKHKIELITKDVDFCIGKKVSITIDKQPSMDLIIPVLSVEVKTYLDATMFGEVKSSSKSIKSASPNSRTYVLMGYKCIADEHIIAAREDSVLNEIFVLRKNETSPIDGDVLYDYWKEIFKVIETIATEKTITVPGRLLNPQSEN